MALLKQDVDDINAFLAEQGSESQKYVELAASVGLITLQVEDD